MTTAIVTVPQPKAADGDYTFVKQVEANTVACTVGTVGWPAGAQTAPVVTPPTNDLTGALVFVAPNLTEVNTGGPTTSPFPRPGTTVAIKTNAVAVGNYVVVSSTPAAGQVRFTNNGIQVNAVDAAAVDHTAAFTALHNTAGTVTWTFVALPA